MAEDMDPATGQQAPDSDAEPGSVSSQRDVEGRGPVTLQERTRPGGQASPDTNQGKAEPIPPTSGDADPAAPRPAPPLEQMNVGAADPQSPTLPGARARTVPQAQAYAGPVNPGVVPARDRPAIDADSTSKLPEGPERPAQAGPGAGQRAPGSLGVSPEEQETDTETGAAHMQPGGRSPHAEPGEAHGVSVPHEVPATGTSEQQGIVQGTRTAVPPS